MTKRHDEPVELAPGATLRISADAIRALRKATGRAVSELTADETDEAMSLQVQAFAELHRRYAIAGHLPDAAELWERAGAVELEFTAPADPLADDSSATSPPSAGTGG
jgi:hypothetical protein